MTDSEKRLLSIDLCGRLPYGAKIQVTSFDCVLDEYGEETNVVEEKNVVCNLYMMTYDSVFYEGDWIPLEYCKPYLRPLKETYMTEAEAIYYNTVYTCLPYTEKVDWLNEHMFDYRKLIEQGLALQSPEGMYNFV
jgi:hypothetical protein